MRVFYNFNWNPFCHVCLDVMMVERPPGDLDDFGNIRSYAHCVNKECRQFNWRFIIEPLNAEAVPVENQERK